jgi:hypothetical protein
VISVTTNFRVRTKRPKARDRRDGEDHKHRENLRLLRCCVCGAPAPNTVHHLKTTGRRGVGMRSPDRFGLPMCWFPSGDDCHGQIERIGSRNELKWLRERGVDGIELADALWNNRHSLEAMSRIIAAHTTYT